MIFHMNQMANIDSPEQIVCLFYDNKSDQLVCELVCGWFVFSSGVSFYKTRNKWVFKLAFMMISDFFARTDAVNVTADNLRIVVLSLRQ